MFAKDGKNIMSAITAVIRHGETITSIEYTHKLKSNVTLANKKLTI